MYLRSVPILTRSRSSVLVEQDALTRQSDVTVSTNITSYAEYKGFFVYVFSALLLCIWTFWALIPEWVLEDVLSITYYPDKFWSGAIPVYSLILMLYTYVALALYNTEVRTLPLDDIRNFFDSYSDFPGQDNDLNENLYRNSIAYIHKAPSGVRDLPITIVNDVLYSEEVI